MVLAIGDFDSGGFAHFFHLGDRLVVTEGSYKMDNPDFLAWIATPPKVKKVSGKIDIRTGMTRLTTVTTSRSTDTCRTAVNAAKTSTAKKR